MASWPWRGSRQCSGQGLCHNATRGPLILIPCLLCPFFLLFMGCLVGRLLKACLRHQHTGEKAGAPRHLHPRGALPQTRDVRAFSSSPLLVALRSAQRWSQPLSRYHKSAPALAMNFEVRLRNDRARRTPSLSPSRATVDAHQPPIIPPFEGAVHSNSSLPSAASSGVR